MSKVVVVGATGNVGLAVMRALSASPDIDSAVGLARRRPGLDLPGVTWAEADVLAPVPELARMFAGADAVIHLAWLIQPSRDERKLWDVNAAGTKAVLEAIAAAGVPAAVVASSVGAYSPGPKDHAVDESWPTDGVGTSSYSRQKAYTERVMDAFEARNPATRLVRLRPGLIFQAGAASEIRRYFAGPFVPRRLLSPRLLPVVPRMPGLVFQAVHADDVAQAYLLAAVRDVRGPFNIAADPVLDADRLAAVLHAAQLPVPPRVAKALAAIAWRLRLDPTEPGWLDLALSAPVMDTRRAREELGWTPEHISTDALLELLNAMSRGDGAETEPLSPDSARGRIAEVRTGVGATDRA